MTDQETSEISDSTVQNGDTSDFSESVSPLLLSCLTMGNLPIVSLLAWSQHDRDHKIGIRQAIEGHFNAWIKEVAVSKHINRHEECRGQVLAFGSFVLEGAWMDADLNLLALAPSFIERELFTTEFVRRLLTSDPLVENIRVLPDAYVPAVKMTIGNTEVDLIFSRLGHSVHNTTQVTEGDFIGQMNSMSLKCIRSLNSFRNCERILNMVGDVERFRETLTIVKCWARLKGIYSSVLGYLSGMVCSLMVALICRLYPKATTDGLIYSFFRVYSVWDWRVPIRLVDKPLDAALLSVGLRKDIWYSSYDPVDLSRSQTRGLHVITPCFPYQNCAFNMTGTARCLLSKELNRAVALIEKLTFILLPRFTMLLPTLNNLRFDQHLQLTIERRENTLSGEFLEFSRLVESRIHLLTQKLEQDPRLKLVHVLPHREAGACFVWRWSFLLQLTARAFNNLRRQQHRRSKRGPWCSNLWQPMNLSRYVAYFDRLLFDKTPPELVHLLPLCQIKSLPFGNATKDTFEAGFHANKEECCPSLDTVRQDSGVSSYCETSSFELTASSTCCN